MLSDAQFVDLLNRTRNGDQDAARVLVEEYEPEIRRAARMRLTDPHLRRIVDSMDICQSVFGRFFRSATEGSFDLERPEQLLVLLITMTRNRVIDEHRRQTTTKRSGRDIDEFVSTEELVEVSPGPRTAAAARELLTEVRSRLSQEELAKKHDAQFASLKGQSRVELKLVLGSVSVKQGDSLSGKPVSICSSTKRRVSAISEPLPSMVSRISLSDPGPGSP